VAVHAQDHWTTRFRGSPLRWPWIGDLCHFTIPPEPSCLRDFNRVEKGEMDEAEWYHNSVFKCIAFAAFIVDQQQWAV
jgi:hypothetical protein